MHGRSIKPKFYSRLWLDCFMIDEKYQGRGYGKIALKKILPILFEQYQCQTIYLSVHVENKNAIKLYETLGFKKQFLKILKVKE